MRAWRLASLAGLAVLVPPGMASAHAFAERYDLPLPLAFYLAGAGCAVALSFLGSFLLMRPGRGRQLCIDLPVPPGIAAAAGWVLCSAGLMLLSAVVVIGFAGPRSPTENFATVFIWVFWWVGFTLFTALVVDLWTPVGPVGCVLRAVERFAGHGQPAVPAAAEWLPLAGLLAISWLELVSDWSEDPRAMAVIVLLYLALTAAGGLLFGSDAWLRRADPLERLFGLLGRVAPVTVVRGSLRIRLPGTGLAGAEVTTAGAWFVIALIAVVLFDGLSETPVWTGLLDLVTRSETLRPWLLDLRAAGVDILKLLRTAGLLSTVAVAILLYGLLSLAVWRAAGGTGRLREVFCGFAPSLLPIAVAYHLAHYASYLALAGQLMLPILSDPLGLGWDLFGTARHRIDIGVIDAEGVWWIAVAALVAGHALSVFVAHTEALRLFPDRRRAVLSQIPMMIFMVGLTGCSLWILAQPIVV